MKKNELLAVNELYENFKKPIFEKNINKDSITISLKYIQYYRNYSNVKDYREDDNKYYLIFFNNGDIQISSHKKYQYRTSLLFKDMTTHYDNSPRFLSYTETIDMLKYIKEQNINLNFKKHGKK